MTDAYRALSDADRHALRCEWVARLGEAAEAAHHYQTFPLESRADVLVWLAAPMTSTDVPATFFRQLARQLSRFRRYLCPVHVLWGFTRPSEYSSARSRQAIDPFQPRTLPYLVMYPFTKTKQWYREDAEARQAMMNEHIALGKQYRDVKQLLVYSFGLQDQEFVVVYEVPDLERFSGLVAELRRTRGRAYTERDGPLHTALHCPADTIDDPWP